MNADRLRDLVLRWSRDEITPEEHEELQSVLRASHAARASFRETMDVEAGLRAWAAERTTSGDRRGPVPVPGPRRRRIVGLALAASIALVAALWWLWPQSPAPEPGRRTALGTLRPRAGCVWGESPARLVDDGFTTGSLHLVEGVARLSFDSGTDLVVEGPCELAIVAEDAARLGSGNVSVEVFPRSDGFTLETPDARILDEGTEYAVKVREEDTEVHVLDGAVVWETRRGTSRAMKERIEAGEARRYERSRPGRGARIPLDARLFVRRLEEDLRESVGVDLLAYDGFEYLAGKLRRGRHGFGWTNGWRSGGARRGPLASVADAPADRVFGIERAGRRLLRLEGRASLQRTLASPLSLDPGETVHVGILITRHADGGTPDGRIEISLHEASRRPQRTARGAVAFGITATGIPYVACGESTARGPEAIEDGKVHLFVARISVDLDGGPEIRLRVYRPGEIVDASEPGSWTVASTGRRADPALGVVRLAVGAGANYDVDELMIGRTWRSVIGGR